MKDNIVNYSIHVLQGLYDDDVILHNVYAYFEIDQDQRKKK